MGFSMYIEPVSRRGVYGIEVQRPARGPVVHLRQVHEAAVEVPRVAAAVHIVALGHDEQILARFQRRHAQAERVDDVLARPGRRAARPSSA